MSETETKNEASDLRLIGLGLFAMAEALEAGLLALAHALAEGYELEDEDADEELEDEETEEEEEVFPKKSEA